MRIISVLFFLSLATGQAAEKLFETRPYQLEMAKALAVAVDVRGATPALDLRKAPVRGWVVVFMGTQCRLVRDYLDRLKGWSEAWAKDGIQVVGVFSNEQESAKEIAEFANGKNPPFLILHDEQGKIARSLRAERTPESFLLGEDFRVHYRGRIDDQFGLAITLPKANHSYLADAVSAMLDGKFPSPAVVDMEGCFINLGDPHPPVTFNQDIAPLVYQRCTRCHRDNEVGGELFKLTSYETIAPHAATLSWAVEERTMPPWRGGLVGKFRNEFALDATEIWLLREWNKLGAPLGDGPSPVAPPAPSAQGFRSGVPSAVVYMTPEDAPEEKKFFRIPPRSETAVLPYRYFRVKTDFKEDKWLVSAEIKALVPEVVHHVTVFLMPPPKNDDWIIEDSKSKKLALRLIDKKYNIAPENFEWTFRLYGKGMRRPLGLVATYSPTEPTRHLPDGFGLLIPKGAELVFEAHYTPTEGAKLDRTAVGLWFADKVPTNSKAKQVITRSAAFMNSIQVPPGGKLSLTREMHFFADAQLFSLRPHMHQRGKTFTGILERPDGTKETLVHVPAWDYNWQIEYQFEKPIRVPKGSILHSIYDWDNTERPGNPDHTKHLRFGQQIDDEMCLSYPTYIYDNVEETDEAERQMEERIYEDGP